MSAESQFMRFPEEVRVEAPVQAGLFSVEHGLGAAPRLVLIRMTSGGLIWQAKAHDDKYLYLESSGEGISCVAECWR